MPADPSPYSGNDPQPSPDGLDSRKEKPDAGEDGTEAVTLHRIRTQIEGCLELGLPDMAEEELDALTPAQARHPLLLDARLSFLMHTRRWAEAVQTGLLGCAAAPGAPAFFIHTAFCLHELGRTGEAHLLLVSGPEALQLEPLHHYNLACYLVVLERSSEAGSCLTRAFQLDPSLRKFARTDRDLEPLWPMLKEF